MDKCQHEAHNWDLVYRCQGCKEIVQEQNARIREASLEHQNKLLQQRIKALEGENEMLKTAVNCADIVFKKYSKQIDGVIDDPSRDLVFCVFETQKALQEEDSE